MVRVEVRGLPDWIDASRLLGPGGWALEGDVHVGELDRREAADLLARLRGIGLGGRALEVSVHPPLKRPLIRAARAEDARRRRQTTPGFTRPGAQLDDEGRMSLTPEALALGLGERYAGQRVVDATCGAGGNAIGFARAGCQVVAVDRDGARLRMARHNARLYGVEDRITFVHGRAEDQAPDADLLFLDPPWGADWDRTRTTLDDLPALAGLLALAPRYPTTLVKLPPSFDPSTVPGAVPEAVFGEAPGDYRRVKFVLLRIISRGSSSSQGPPDPLAD